MENGIVVTKLILIPSRGDYKSVYQRSYDINVGHNDLSKIEAVFAMNGVGSNNKITDVSVASALSNVVSISDGTTGVVDIPNGWGTQRLRFLMEVEQNVGNGMVCSYLQGFSEYHDPSISGMIDPVMKFHINSITNVSKTPNPMTGGLMVRLSNTYNVITDLAGGTKYEELHGGPGQSSDLKLIRPNDIIEDIALGDLAMGGNVDTVNRLGVVGDLANTSNRGNSDSTKFFTNTLNNVITSKNLADSSYDLQDVMRTASQNTVEASVISNPFIYALHKMTGVETPSSFTMGQLERIDPGIGAKTYMSNGDNSTGYRETIMDTGDTADMLQPTIENKIATQVSHSMTSMMAENLITKLSLSMTNMSGNNITVPSDFRSFIDGIDTLAYINRIVDRCNNVLLPDLTRNGLVVLNINVEADLLGDTTVIVEYELAPAIVFRFPVFTDSLFTPVITDSVGRKSMGDDMANLIDATYEASNVML